MVCCSSEAYFWPNIWFDFRFHIPVQGVSLNLKLWPCSWILGFSLPSWSNVVLAISSNVNIVFNVPHKTYSCATIIIIKATFHWAEFSTLSDIFFCLKTNWQRVGIERQKRYHFTRKIPSSGKLSKGP